MSNSNVSEKDEENDPCQEPVKKCPHEFCHRDLIESDRPIGLPFASGLLKYIPGQEPDPYNFKQRKILQKKKCLEQKEKEIAKMIDACPPILDNLLTNDPEIADEMKYIFNFILEVGDNDVGEYIKTYKENKAEEARKAEEAKKAEEAAEGSVAAEDSVAASSNAGEGEEEGPEVEEEQP